MDTKKILDTMGIVPIRSLNFQEINEISKNFAELMLQTFSNLNLNYVEICKKMFQCKMYIAEFDARLGNANYIHKNNSIYIRNETEINCKDAYILHELIHYFQDTRNENGELRKIGICDFAEFKVKGLALNESGVQYVVSKMLEIPEENSMYYNIPLKTKSKEYYPLICDLLNKIIYFLGDESLIDSVLFSTDKFKLEVVDSFGEDALNEIQNNFDAIIELQSKIRKRK